MTAAIRNDGRMIEIKVEDTIKLDKGLRNVRRDSTKLKSERMTRPG